MTESGDTGFVDAVIGEATRKAAATPGIRRGDWQLATVTAVNTDGTVDVGAIRARALGSYLNPAAGDLIVLSQNGKGNWIAIGRTATSAATAWTAYTPVWTASATNPTVGNSTLSGRYQKMGRTVHLQINLIRGSTATLGSGDYSFSLPVQAANAGCTYVGNAHLLIPGGGRWGGQFVISPGATTAAPFFSSSTTNPRLTWWTGVVPESFISGAHVRITVTYESAS